MESDAKTSVYCRQSQWALQSYHAVVQVIIAGKIHCLPLFGL